MAHSTRRNRKIFKNRRGFSTIVATIFMVLAVLFLYFNVFMFMQTQNTKLQDVISQSTQLDADHTSELGLSIPSASYVQNALNSQQFVITCSLVNNSPLPVQLVRLWVQDYQPSPSIAHVPESVVLQPGAKNTYTFTVTLPRALPNTSSLKVWFITSRGNSVFETIS